MFQFSVPFCGLPTTDILLIGASLTPFILHPQLFVLSLFNIQLTTFAINLSIILLHYYDPLIIQTLIEIILCEDDTTTEDKSEPEQQAHQELRKKAKNFQKRKELDASRNTAKPLNHQESPSEQQVSHLNQNKSPPDHLESPLDYLEFSLNHQKSPLNHQKSPPDRIESPFNHKGSSSDHQESPINQLESPHKHQDSLLNHQKSSDHTESKLDNLESPTDCQESQIKEIKSPPNYQESVFNNQKSCLDLKNVPLNQISLPDPHESPLDHKTFQPNHKEPQLNQKKFLLNYKESPANQKKLLPNHKESPPDQREVQSDHQQSPFTQKPLPDKFVPPLNDQELTPDHLGSPPDHQEFLINLKKSPFNQQESPLNHHESPQDYKESLLNQQQKAPFNHQEPQKVLENNIKENILTFHAQESGQQSKEITDQVNNNTEGNDVKGTHSQNSGSIAQNRSNSGELMAALHGMPMNGVTGDVLNLLEENNSTNVRKSAVFGKVSGAATSGFDYHSEDKSDILVMNGNTRQKTTTSEATTSAPGFDNINIHRDQANQHVSGLHISAHRNLRQQSISGNNKHKTYKAYMETDPANFKPLVNTTHQQQQDELNNNNNNNNKRASSQEEDTSPEDDSIALTSGDEVQQESIPLLSPELRCSHLRFGNPDKTPVQVSPDEQEHQTNVDKSSKENSPKARLLNTNDRLVFLAKLSVPIQDSNTKRSTGKFRGTGVSKKANQVAINSNCKDGRERGDKFSSSMQPNLKTKKTDKVNGVGTSPKPRGSDQNGVMEEPLDATNSEGAKKTGTNKSNRSKGNSNRQGRGDGSSQRNAQSQRRGDPKDDDQNGVMEEPLDATNSEGAKKTGTNKSNRSKGNSNRQGRGDGSSQRNAQSQRRGDPKDDDQREPTNVILEEDISASTNSNYLHASPGSNMGACSYYRDTKNNKPPPTQTEEERPRMIDKLTGCEGNPRKLIPRGIGLSERITEDQLSPTSQPHLKNIQLDDKYGVQEANSGNRPDITSDEDQNQVGNLLYDQGLPPGDNYDVQEAGFRGRVNVTAEVDQGQLASPTYFNTLQPEDETELVVGSRSRVYKYSSATLVPGKAAHCIEEFGVSEEPWLCQTQHNNLEAVQPHVENLKLVDEEYIQRAGAESRAAMVTDISMREVVQPEQELEACSESWLDQSNHQYNAEEVDNLYAFVGSLTTCDHCGTVLDGYHRCGRYVEFEILPKL